MTTRRFLTVIGCTAIGLTLTGCQLGGSTISEREGYFTWVDEQGRVRYSPIAESAAQMSAARQEAREGERQEALADDEFTLANYPDAEELRSRGYVREEDGQPYFTWRDADGNVRTTYYQPDTRTDEEKGFVAPPAGTTPARVYRAGDVPLAPEPSAGHDPDAFAILGIEEGGDNYLARFSETCCQALDTKNHERWQEGREFGIRLTGGSPVHRFLTGESPYQLIALPHDDGPGEWVLRLRSYASKGVFVPSVVFLDSELSPVRLVTDLVADFEPENWHRRGYLEARISVFAANDERWMLVFTRGRDLEGQTVIETRLGPRKIPHVSTGELGLIMMGTQ